MKRVGTIAAVACLVLAACEGRSVDVLRAGPTDVAPAADSGSGPTCFRAGGASFCGAIPRANTARTIDGAGDEFCRAPSMIFAVDDAPWKRGVGSFPEIATIHATWSIDGVYMHVHVTDPIIVTGPDDNLAAGDAIELYLGATSDLHGPINGRSDGGALQVIVVPPGSGHPARAATYFHPTRGIQTSAPFDPSRFAARLVDDGYEVEIVIPWAGPAPLLGAAIGFDVAIDVADVDVATGRQLQAAIGYRYPDGTSNCTDDVGPQPFCDDRTWCTPHLAEEAKEPSDVR